MKARGERRTRSIVSATALGIVFLAIGLFVAARWRSAADAEAESHAEGVVSTPSAKIAGARADGGKLAASIAAPKRQQPLLVSTAIAEIAANSRATLLVVGAGGRRVLRPGDALGDGTVVEWIEAGRVGLRSESGRWTLGISPVPPPTPKDLPLEVPVEAQLREPAPDADDTIPGNLPILDMFREDPGRVNLVNLLSEAPFAFRFDEANGDILGMTLSSVPRDSVYSQLGIQSGDTLLSVNGIEIDGPEAAESALGEIVTTPKLRILLQRAERTEEVVVERIVTEDAQADLDSG